MMRGTDPLFSGDGIACFRGERLVFRDLGFTLAAGEALVLTGPNGSGKSSLLRLMAGLSSPAAGRISWDSTDIAKDRQTHATRLHYVGHATGTKAALTAGEDLAFWSTFRLQDHGPTQQRALEQFGLLSRTSFPVRFLSSGQKRRLALARLVAAPAPLWLLDEPTVGLDNDGQAALEAAIAAHRAACGIAVIASHTAIALGGVVHTLDLRDFIATGTEPLDPNLNLALSLDLTADAAR
jgi:heme exporter protein A